MPSKHSKERVTGKTNQCPQISSRMSSKMPSSKLDKRDTQSERSFTLQRDGKALKSTLVEENFKKSRFLATYSEPLQSTQSTVKKTSSKVKLQHFESSSEKKHSKFETNQELNARKSKSERNISNEGKSGSHETKSRKNYAPEEKVSPARKCVENLSSIGKAAFSGNSSSLDSSRLDECKKDLMPRKEHNQSSSKKRNVQQKKSLEVQECSKRSSFKTSLSHKENLSENRKSVNRSCSEKLTSRDNQGLAGSRNSFSRSKETDIKRNTRIKNNLFHSGCSSRKHSETDSAHRRGSGKKSESSKSLSKNDLVQIEAKKMKECALNKAKDGKWRESHDLLQDVVKIHKGMEELGPPYYDPIDLADTYYRLGITLNWLGETQDALDAFEESLCLRRLNGEDDVHVASVLSYIGMIQGNKGDYDSAIYNLGLARLIQRRCNENDATTSQLLKDYSRARDSLGNRALAA